MLSNLSIARRIIKKLFTSNIHSCISKMYFTRYSGQKNGYLPSAISSILYNGNKAGVGVMFSMKGYSGKYIRIGIYRGGMINTNTTGLQQINTREIVVFRSRKAS